MIKGYLLFKKLTTYTYYKCQLLTSKRLDWAVITLKKLVHSVYLNKHAQFEILIHSSGLFSCHTIQKHNQSVLKLTDLRWYCVSPVRQLVYKIIHNWLWKQAEKKLEENSGLISLYNYVKPGAENVLWELSLLQRNRCQYHFALLIRQWEFRTVTVLVWTVQVHGLLTVASSGM